ncbi:MAG: ChaN family lipoprotein [Hyphomicrobiales bacterium]|nr:ChaN family lipoprotein [Hyphomicrobiales bacterium]
MPPDDAGTACSMPGGWVDVATGTAYERRVLFHDLATSKSVVLLGESHDNVDHHRWQLHTLAAVHGRVEKMVIGFEAFPRRLQPVLDQWVEGMLTADALLKEARWLEIWGYDPGFYMPMFEFARLHEIPMVALNVERALVSQVGEKGWAAVPAEEREGVSDPAPASPAYEHHLARVFQAKDHSRNDESEPDRDPHGEAGLEAAEKALAEAMEKPEFRRFVEAQLTWDRAMAEALAAARREFPGTIVAGILGTGHVEDGYGVPYQLQDLGVADVAVLIPVEAGSKCRQIVGTGYADAVFTLPPALAAPSSDRPKLGIFIADGEHGVRINEVIADSVAEATELREADEIVAAAGVATKTMGELIEIVSRQAPGTWLPLRVRRDGQQIELIAKFPPRPLPQRPER